MVDQVYVRDLDYVADDDDLVVSCSGPVVVPDLRASPSRLQTIGNPPLPFDVSSTGPVGRKLRVRFGEAIREAERDLDARG
ncbi:hypothetical protein WL21_18805 [Burkholderia ubonensis]|nr:hypothetical protein WL21_18805 [Burkholderia ubonensis]KVZ69942.1 hypothetical protein WL20_05005 [Burkholderia ubonensis]